MKLFKGCLMLVGGFFVLIVISALFFGENSNRANNSEVDTSEVVNSSNSSFNQAQEPVPVGTLTDVRGDRAIQIEYSEIVDSISSGNQFFESVDAKGGKLAVVYMTLKNTGQESGDMLWTEFQLIDGKERKYDEIEDFEEAASVNSWLESQGLERASNQLFPGATAQTAKVFRVAPDASDLKLLANDKSFDIQQKGTTAGMEATQ